MPPNIQIMQVGPGTDGTGATPVKAQNMVQNDAYFLDKLAERWAKDTAQAQPGLVHRLDRLPHGYAGFEKHRGGDSKHVDRYLLGHPSGQFRSINEAYPHFKHLQDFGGPVGCACVLCTGHKKKKANGSLAPNITGNGDTKSPYFSAQSQAKPQKRPGEKVNTDRFWNSSTPPRAQQADEDGTPDLYRSFFDRLKEAQPDGLRERITDSMSPDWRAGHHMLQSLLEDWQQLPNYVPRVGELVLFARNITFESRLAWDRSRAALLSTKPGSKAWLRQPQWEAGVVTQMPVEALSFQDLTSIAPNKKQSINYSGFRIEPLSEASGKENKPYAQRHKYMPLHLIRPFWAWQECMSGTNEEDWDPSIKHALTMASSLCVVGKFELRGTWPDVTVFTKAAFVGPELIMVGDAVRLLPRPGDKPADVVTDIMIVSSIRLRCVHLEQANDDDYDKAEPYNLCLHICGTAYTLDPKRSFDGIGTTVPQTEGDFPEWLTGYGRWFPVLDPKKPKLKLEIPFTRVFGRVYERAAMNSMFRIPSDMDTTSGTFQAVNQGSITRSKTVGTISQGLSGIVAARKYSQVHDARIDRPNSKRWFWAETRIEQLDLHDVNGQSVGVKDDKRSRKQMVAWRQALKVLDGKKGAVDDYRAARDQRQKEQKMAESLSVPAGSPWGMLASTQAGAESGTDGEKAEAEATGEDAYLEEQDAMDVDDEEGEAAGAEMVEETIGVHNYDEMRDGDDDDDVEETPHKAPSSLPMGTDIIELDSESEDEDDMRDVESRFGLK